jgi:ATP-dependent DNA ligase
VRPRQCRCSSSPGDRRAGDRLLDTNRDVGAEGIIAKRRTGVYRSGPSRERLKTKCSEVGRFVINGFRDVTPGEIEAVTVTEVVDDKLLSAGATAGRRQRRRSSMMLMSCSKKRPSPSSSKLMMIGLPLKIVLWQRSSSMRAARPPRATQMRGHDDWSLLPSSGALKVRVSGSRITPASTFVA